MFTSSSFRYGVVDYLNVILEREGQDCFKSITFKNTELPSEGQDNKAAFVDFLFVATVETEACEYIDLEIQSYYDSSLPNRILYYGAKLLTTSGIKKVMSTKIYAKILSCAFKESLSINKMDLSQDIKWQIPRLTNS